MTTINTIEDLVRILREQPAWAEAVRSVLLTDDLLDLPARFDRFVQSQEETNRRLSELLAQQSEQLAKLNEAHDDTRQRLIGLEERFDRFVQSQEETNRRQEETNRRLSEMLAQQSELLAELKEISDDTRQRLTSLEGRVNRVEGRLGNLEGGQYERTIRAKALARSQFNLGLGAVYYALSQDGIADSRLISAVGRALRDDTVTTADSGDLFETDLIISDEDNRHAVFEVSLTADDHDILRSKRRAEILETITGGAVTPVVITAHIDDARNEQADAEGVTVFVIPYP